MFIKYVRTIILVFIGRFDVMLHININTSKAKSERVSENKYRIFIDRWQRVGNNHCNFICILSNGIWNESNYKCPVLASSGPLFFKSLSLPPFLQLRQHKWKICSLNMQSFSHLKEKPLDFRCLRTCVCVCLFVWSEIVSFSFLHFSLILFFPLRLVHTDSHFTSTLYDFATLRLSFLCMTEWDRVKEW